MGGPQESQQHTWDQVPPASLPSPAPAPWGLQERREEKVGGWVSLLSGTK